MSQSPTQIIEFIHQAVRMEIQVGQIYALFARGSEEHRDFWIQLSIEEKRHASIFRNFEIELATTDMPAFSGELDLQGIKKMNSEIAALADQIKTDLPNPTECFSIGIELEGLNAEYYIQILTDGTYDHFPFVRIIKRLLKDDRDHLHRIQSRLAEYS